MKYIIIIIEYINYLLYGSLHNIRFKIIKRDEYEEYEDNLTHNIIPAKNGIEELWIPIYPCWFPGFLRKKYFLTYYQGETR